MTLFCSIKINFKKLFRSVFILCFLSTTTFYSCSSNTIKTELTSLEPAPVSLSFKGFLNQHGNALLSFDYSSDGKMIVSGGTEKIIRLSDSSGKVVQIFTGHQSQVSKVVFSPDDKKILSTSADSTVILWDTNGKKINTFRKDDGYFSTAVFSPDGKTILTAGSNGIAQIWDLKGKLINSFKGHSKYLSAAIFSPDGKMVLTSSSDNSAKLWTLDGNCFYTFSDFQFPIKTIAFSPDGQSVLISSYVDKCRQWKLDGTLLQTYEGTRAAFSPDGKTVITGFSDRKWLLNLWDLNGNLITGTRFYTNRLTELKFSPDGNQVIACSKLRDTKYASLCVFNIKKEDPNTLFLDHDNSINGIDYSKSGNCILTSSSDSTALLSSMDGKKIQTFRGHQGGLYACRFSPDGKTVATTSFIDKTLKIWSVDGTLIRTLKPYQYAVNDFDFSPDNKHLITCGNGSGSNIHLWTINGEPVKELGKMDRGIKHIEFNTSGNGFTVRNDYQAKSFDLDGKENPLPFNYKDLQCLSPTGNYYIANHSLFNSKGQELQFLNDRFGDNQNRAYTAFCFLPNDKGFLLGTREGLIELWRIDGQKVKEFRGHTLRILKILMLNDDNKFISLGEDQTIRKWTLENLDAELKSDSNSFFASVAVNKKGDRFLSCGAQNQINVTDSAGKIIQTLKGHQGYISDLKFSPNNKFILSGSFDNTAILWDKKGKQKHIFDKHSDNVLTVNFSQDGSKILTGSRDGTVKIWSTEKGKLLKSIKAHEGAVFDVSFTPDGKNLLTAGGDHVAKIWDLEGKMIIKFGNSNHPIHKIKISPDGQNIITAGKNSPLILRNAKGDSIQRLDYPSSYITSIAFSPDGKFAAHIYRNTINVYNIETKKKVNSLNNKYPISSIDFLPNSKGLIYGSTFRKLQTWNFSIEPFNRSELGGGGYVGILPDKKTLFLGSLSHHQFSDLEGNNVKHNFNNTNRVNDVSPDGKMLLQINRDDKLEIAGIDSKKPSFTSSFKCYFATFSNNGKYILATNDNHTFILKNNGDELLDIYKEGAIYYTRRAEFSSDDKEFLITGAFGTAYLYDLNGKILQSFVGDYKNKFTATTFSPDNKFIYLGSEDGTLSKWSREGQLIQEFTAHQNNINSIIFSPDKKSILTASSDNLAKLWDLEGNLKRTLSGNARTVWYTAFYNNGKRIITSETDRINIWELD